MHQKQKPASAFPGQAAWCVRIRSNGLRMIDGVARAVHGRAVRQVAHLWPNKKMVVPKVVGGWLVDFDSVVYKVMNVFSSRLSKKTHQIPMLRVDSPYSSLVAFHPEKKNAFVKTANRKICLNFRGKNVRNYHQDYRLWGPHPSPGHIITS